MRVYNGPFIPSLIHQRNPVIRILDSSTVGNPLPQGDYSSLRRQRGGGSGGGLAPQHGGASPDYTGGASTRDSDFGFGLQMSSRDKAAVSTSKTGEGLGWKMHVAAHLAPQ